MIKKDLDQVFFLCRFVDNYKNDEVQCEKSDTACDVKKVIPHAMIKNVKKVIPHANVKKVIPPYIIDNFIDKYYYYR